MEQAHQQSAFKKQLLAVAIGAAIAVTGCSSNNNSSDKKDPQTINLSGYAIKGVMINADIKVYDLASDALLKETTTNAQGQYSLAGITAEDEALGNLKVVMTTNANTKTKCDSAVGCTDTNDASVAFGQTYDFHDPAFELTAILSAPGEDTATASLMVTPLTHMAATRIESEGSLTSEAIAEVNRETAVLMGLDNVDISTLQPVDLTDANSASADDNAVKYGAMLAAVATVAAEKDMSLPDMIQKMSDDYAKSQGLKAHSSDDTDIDLADLFAAAVDSMDMAEMTLGIDIDNSLEVGMLARRNEAADATIDEVTVIDDADSGVGTPTLTAEEQATLRGIALLEELNEWNDTLVDVQAQLVDSETALINHAEDVAELEAAMEEQSGLARAVQTLAYGITEEEVIEYYSYDYCDRWTWSVDLQQDVCTEWKTYNGEYSWTDTYETGVLTNVPYLVQEFGQLANLIADHHDDIKATKDEATGLYQFTLNASLAESLWEADEFSFDFGFIYGYEGVEVENTGSLNIGYSLDEHGNPASFSVVGTSGFPEEGTAIKLNGLSMEQKVINNAVILTVSQLDLVDTVDTSLLDEELAVEVTYSATGELTATFADADAVDAFLANEDSANAKLLGMDFSMESDVSESASDAEEAGFSPASGELDVSISLTRESLDAPVVASTAAKADVRNAAGDFITGTLTGSGNVSTMELGKAVLQLSAEFDGTMSQAIHDESHEFNGATAMFNGNLKLNVPQSGNKVTSSQTLDFDGILSLQDATGNGASFEGKAKYTEVIPLRADGEHLIEEQFSYYSDYWDETWGTYQSVAMIPTELSLNGKLSAIRQNVEFTAVEVKASAMLKDLETVVAKVEQADLIAGEVIGSTSAPALEISGISLEQNRFDTDFTHFSSTEFMTEVESYLESLNLTGVSYNFYQNSQIVSSVTLLDNDCHSWYQVYHCDLQVNLETREIYQGEEQPIWSYEDFGYLQFTEAEFKSGMHLNPALWAEAAMSNHDYWAYVNARVVVHSDQGSLEFKTQWNATEDTDLSSVDIVLTNVALYGGLIQTISTAETADDYVGMAVSLEIALDAFDYEDASVQILAERTGQNTAEGKLALQYGSRTIEIDLAGNDNSISTDETRITISNQDTEMSLTATCASLSDEEDQTLTSLSECDNQDLNFGGTITVDGLEIGTLEDRNGLPVFVFGNGSEYQMIATPSFLISRQ